GGLAGPVGPQQPVGLSGGDPEGHAVHRGQVPEPLHQPVDDQDVLPGWGCCLRLCCLRHGCCPFVSDVPTPHSVWVNGGQRQGYLSHVHQLMCHIRVSG